MKKDYPYWAYKTKKEWLRQSRKRWNLFRKMIKQSEIKTGCAYLPEEVYDWLIQFDKMDKFMKKFYKNA